MTNKDQNNKKDENHKSDFSPDRGMKTENQAPQVERILL